MFQTIYLKIKSLLQDKIQRKLERNYCGLHKLHFMEAEKNLRYSHLYTISFFLFFLFYDLLIVLA